MSVDLWAAMMADLLVVRMVVMTVVVWAAMMAD